MLRKISKFKPWLLRILITIFICFCCAARLFTVKKKHPSQVILSLTYDQISSNASQDFVDFILQERLRFKYSKDLILLEIRKLNLPKIYSNQTNFIICRDYATFVFIHVFEWHLINSFIQKFIRIDLTYDHSKTIKQNFKLIKSRNFDNLVWSQLNENNSLNIDLITTQTHLNKLPIYFEENLQFVNRIMLWYSINSRVIGRKNIQIQEKYVSKEIIEKIDQHYVWNSAQFIDLESQGIPKTKLKIVGSIIFLPIQEIHNKAKALSNITFFDITPISGKSNFYSDELAINTLNMILNAIIIFNQQSNKNITLTIKPKRRPQRIHSKKYLDFRRQLADQGMIELLSHQENLYNRVRESSAVIALPYGSPVFIAQEMGIPNTFVFADNSDWDVQNRHGVEIQRNALEFLNWLHHNLKFT
jgi:hypothetical protein